MKNPRSISLSFLALALLLLFGAACMPVVEAPASEEDVTERTFYVGSTLVDCVGVGPQQCLLVKEDPDEEYRMFYDKIEGFDFEEGNEYVLRVAETKVANPPADASSLRWTLLEVIEKTPIATTITGSLWSLDTYVNEDGAETEVLADSTITIQFGEEEFSGDSGCNQFSGAYSSDENTLAVAEPIASTMMACPDPLMRQERDFLAALVEVAGYTMSETELTLTDSDGNTLLIFSAVEPVSLTGTAWIADRYNNGRGGVTTILSDTSISAIFSEDGTLSGSAGCNDYTTTYVTDGTIIQIEAAALTRKMCATPEGIMEQEDAYLAALETAEMYTIEGDLLDLRTADGSRVATFTAQR